MSQDTSTEAVRSRRPAAEVERAAPSEAATPSFSRQVADQVGNASTLVALRGEGHHARFLRGELLLHAAGVVGGLEEWASNTAQQAALRPPAGGGTTLDRRTKRRMENAFGHDFSHVRVHVDSAAAAFAHDLNAHAAAVGADLFFGAGEYQPGTRDGDRLLAHELTHVVQHDRGQLTGKTGVSDPSDAHEREAYANEDRILAVLHTHDLAMESAPRAEAMPESVTERAEEGLGVSRTEVEPSASPSSASTGGPASQDGEAQDYTSIIELLKESEGREVTGEIPDIETDQTEVPVILHDDDPAQQAAAELGRLAFSLGAHLFLGEEASLEDAADQPELLDELTHISIGESAAGELELAEQLQVEATEEGEAEASETEDASAAAENAEEVPSGASGAAESAESAESAPIHEIPGVTDEDHSGLREIAWELETEEAEEAQEASVAEEMATSAEEDEEAAGPESTEAGPAPEATALDAAGRIADVPTYEVAAAAELAPYAEAKASFFDGLGEPVPEQAAPESDAAELTLDAEADTDPRASELQYTSAATQTVDAGVTEATEATPNTATFLATDEQVTDGPTAWWGDPSSEARSKGSEDVEATYSESGSTRETTQDYSATQGDADAGAADTQGGLGSMMSFVAPATMLVPGLSQKTAEAESSSEDLGESTPKMGEIDGQLQAVEGKAAMTEAGAIDADPQVQVERSAEAKQRQTDLVASYEGARGQEAYPAGSLAAETGEAMTSAVSSGAGTSLPGQALASARAEVSPSETSDGQGPDLGGDLEAIAEAMPAEAPSSAADHATAGTSTPEPTTPPAPTALSAPVEASAPLTEAITESADAGAPPAPVEALLSTDTALGSEAGSGAAPTATAGSVAPGSAAPSAPPPVEHEGVMTEAALQIREMNVEQRQLDLQLASLEEVDARIAVEHQAIDQAEGLNASNQAGLDVQDEELATKAENQDQLDAELGEHEAEGGEVEEAAEEEQGGLQGVLSSIMGLFDFFGPLLAGLTGQDGGDEVDAQFGKGAEGGAAVAEDAKAGQDANAGMQEERVSAEDDASEARAQSEVFGGALAEDRTSNQAAGEKSAESRQAATARIEELEAQKEGQLSTYSESKSALLGWVDGQEAEAGAGSDGADSDAPSVEEAQAEGEAQAVEVAGAEVAAESESSEEGPGEVDVHTATEAAHDQAEAPTTVSSAYAPAGADFNFHTEAFADFQAELREQMALDGVDELPPISSQGGMDATGGSEAAVDDGPLDAGEKFDLIWDAFALGGVAGLQDGLAGLGQEVMYTVGEYALEKAADQAQGGVNKIVEYGSKKSGKSIYKAGTKTSQASAKMIAKGGGKGAASTGLKGAAQGASKGAGTGMAKGLVKGGGTGMAKGAVGGAAKGAGKGAVKGISKGIGKSLGKVVPGVGAGVGGVISMADIALTGPDQWAIQQFEGTVGMGVGGAKKIFGKDSDIWTRLDGLLDMVEMLNNALELLVTILDLVALALVAVSAALYILGAALAATVIGVKVGAVLIAVASAILEVAAIISYISLAIGLIVLVVMLVLLGLRALINLGRASTIALSDADASVQQERAAALQDGIEGVTSTAVGAGFEVGTMGVDHAVDGLSSGNVGGEGADNSVGEGGQSTPWSEGKADGERPQDGPSIGAHRTSSGSGPVIGAHRLPPPPHDAAATHEQATAWAHGLIDRDAALVASLETASQMKQLAQHRSLALERNKAAADANEAQIAAELSTLDHKEGRNAEATELAGQAGSEGEGVVSGMGEVATDSQAASGDLSAAEASAPPEAEMQPTDASALEGGEEDSTSAAGEVGPGLHADAQATGQQIASTQAKFGELAAKNAENQAQVDADIAANEADLLASEEAIQAAEADRAEVREHLDEVQAALDASAEELGAWTRESEQARQALASEQEAQAESPVEAGAEILPAEDFETSRDLDVSDYEAVMGEDRGFSEADTLRPDYPTTFDVWLDANSRQVGVSGTNVDALVMAYDGAQKIEAVVRVDGKAQRFPVESMDELDAIYRSLDYKRTADDKQRTTGRGHGKDVMKDRHVAESGLGAKAEASANDVGVVSYNRNIGDSGTNVGFYKPDGANMVSDDARGIGIPENGHFAARAVASSRLDRKLGTDVLSHDHFASHNGGRGVVSAQTQGQAMATNVYAPDPKMTDHLAQGDVSAEDLANMGGFKIGEDGTVSRMVRTDFAEVDLTNPLTQRGLSDLQVMDYLTGQVDRHAGNIFVDADGGVTGIDNDLAFGSNNDNLGMASNQMGLPAQIDAQTAEAVLALSSKDFLKAIGGKRGDYGKLSSDEKRAAKERLKEMKAHIRGLRDEGKLVGSWDAETHAQAIAGAPDSSYTQRAHESLEWQAGAPERERLEEPVAAPEEAVERSEDSSTVEVHLDPDRSGEELVSRVRSEVEPTRSAAKGGTYNAIRVMMYTPFTGGKTSAPNQGEAPRPGQEQLDAEAADHMLQGDNRAQGRARLLVSKMNEALEMVKESDQSDQLKIFMAPEWFFDHQDRPYTQEEYAQTMEILEASTEGLQDVLLVPGTIRWETVDTYEKRTGTKERRFRKDKPVWEQRTQSHLRNTAPIVAGGETVHSYDKLHEGSDIADLYRQDTTEDFSMDLESASLGKGAAAVQAWREGAPSQRHQDAASGLFEYGNLRFGVEICADNSAATLAREIADSDQGDHGVDVHLLMSAGIPTSSTQAAAAREGGYFLRNDATSATRRTQDVRRVDRRDGSVDDALRDPDNGSVAFGAPVGPEDGQSTADRPGDSALGIFPAQPL